MKRTLHSFVLTLEAQNDGSFTEQGEPTYSERLSLCLHIEFPGHAHAVAQAVAQTNETKLLHSHQVIPNVQPGLRTSVLQANLPQPMEEATSKQKLISMATCGSAPLPFRAHPEVNYLVCSSPSCFRLQSLEGQGIPLI